MMLQWSFELGSLLAFITLVILTVDSRRRSAAVAEEKAKTGNKLTQNLISDVAELKLHDVKTDGKLDKIDYALHNGIVDKLNKIIETNDKVNSSQWEHINKNSSDISGLKAKE